MNRLWLLGLASLATVLPALADSEHGVWISPPLSGYGHHPKDKNDNFINPSVKTVLKSSIDGVDAEIVMNKAAFEIDGCEAKSIAPNDATFQITKDGRLAYRHVFKDFQHIAGPQMTANIKQLPTVTLDVVEPGQPEYRNYDYLAATKKYGPRIKDGLVTLDGSKPEPPILAQRQTSRDDLSVTAKWISSAGNLENGGIDWHLEIKKAGQVAWSGPILAEPVEQPISWISIECSGPIILALDPSNKLNVLVRYSVTVKDAFDREDLRNFELIYYFDEATKKFELARQAWGSYKPHLADHERDGTIEFITQNWEFAQPLWLAKDSKLRIGSGGPIQIWRWENNKLVDVTRKYPKEIRRHAEASLNQAKDEPNNPESYLLGYVADLCLLGEEDKAIAELKRLATPNTVALSELITQQLKKCGYLAEK